MQIVIKSLISLVIIVSCLFISKKSPSFAGLIATMPLTGCMVLVWLYYDNSRNYSLLAEYTKGALLGIIPSILFFAVAFFCFRRRIPFPILMMYSFGIWAVGALIHRLLLK